MTYAIKRNPFIPNFPLQQNQSNNFYFNSFQYLLNWFVDWNDKETSHFQRRYNLYRLASPLLRVEWNFFYNYIYKYEFAYKHPRSLIKTYSSIFFREVIRIFIRKARFLPFSKLE